MTVLVLTAMGPNSDFARRRASSVLLDSSLRSEAQAGRHPIAGKREVAGVLPLAEEGRAFFRNLLLGNSSSATPARRLAARHLGPGCANGCANKKRRGKIWFTTQTAHPSFGGDSNHEPRPVSHDPSRKKFLARLLGIVAASSLLPKLFAKSTPAPSVLPSSSQSSEFQLRAAPRTVARRADSL